MVGSAFFCLWATIPENRSIQMETFIFNSIFVIINLFQIIRLLYKMAPPKLTEIESEMYERDFKEVFTRSQFKMLISSAARVEYHSTNSSQICKIGQSYNELIYVARLNHGYSVVLEDSEGRQIYEAAAGSWIGVIEYAKREDYMRNKKIKDGLLKSQLELVWQISAYLKHRPELKTENADNFVKDFKLEISDFKNYNFLRMRNEGCLIYRFDILVIVFII